MTISEAKLTEANNYILVKVLLSGIQQSFEQVREKKAARIFSRVNLSVACPVP